MRRSEAHVCGGTTPAMESDGSIDLGIAVVYLVRDDDGPLLDLHLAHIARNTRVRYRIYAAVNRLQPEFRKLLAARADVEVCACEPTRLRGGREHSHYLTQLVNRALADGATHVATFHVDSFPVQPGWAAQLDRRLKPPYELAAVALREIGNETLPRTTCLFCPRDFYEVYGEVGSTMDLPTRHGLYRDYCRLREGPDDPGDPYGFKLHLLQLSWYRMLRTNGVNDHYILGGIYDDLVFHLGAAARDRKRFGRDTTRDGQPPRKSLLLRIGRGLFPRAWRPKVPDSVRRIFIPADVAQSEANREVYEQIRARLLADPDGYINYLRAPRPENAESAAP